MLNEYNEVAQQHGKRPWSRKQLGEEDTEMVIRFVEMRGINLSTFLGFLCTVNAKYVNS
jgi:hypothetical protein